MTLGQRLKELRCEKEFSQHEIAKLARVAQPTYFAYETDKSTPHINTLDQIARVLGMSLKDLLEGVDNFEHESGPRTPAE